MNRQTYKTMVSGLLGHIKEIFPWDLAEELEQGKGYLLLDIRCPGEFDAAHIPNSINVPRGILEIAVDYGYPETVPELVEARNRPIVVICRSGNRSVLAANTLRHMGYQDVLSLKTGLKGWNDDEYPMENTRAELLEPETIDRLFTPSLSDAQLGLNA